jgi:hypothetical protein
MSAFPDEYLHGIAIKLSRYLLPLQEFANGLEFLI